MEVSSVPAHRAPQLPAELIDMILDALFTCNQHSWSMRANPCTALHPAVKGELPLRSVLSLRRVNTSFHRQLTPILFHRVVMKSKAHRYRMFRYFSKSPLVQHIRVLHFEVSPADLGPMLRRVTQAFQIPVDQKILHYFKMLRMMLPGLLEKFNQLRVLHLTATYDGISEKRLPKLEMVPYCFEALVDCVATAHLSHLEEVTFGVPNEGGHMSYFEHMEDERYEKGLRRTSRNIKSATVVLFDHQGDPTTMPFF